MSADPMFKMFSPLFEATGELQQRFSSAGYDLFAVGGCVRDGLLGQPSDDWDLTTEARPDVIEEIVKPWADATWDQGRRFGTIGARKGDLTVEITTFRADAYEPESRKPIVPFGDELVGDLARRDFTINAMAIKLGAEPAFIDEFGGVSDLMAKRLRTPLDPAISFLDDPLRMLRAARFIARFELTPDEELIRAVAVDRERLSIVSAERIRDELDKLMVVPTTAPGLQFLVDTGLAEHFLPELPGLALEQDPIHHHKDVLTHTMAVVDKTSPERLLRLAALFHDVGKPRTRNFVNGGVTFHHHEVVGARMTKKRMEALKYPTSDVETVVKLVELHLRFHTYKLGWSDKAVRRYVRDAGEHLERLNELTRCDCTTRNAAKARQLDRRMDELQERIEELSKLEDLKAQRPDLDGGEVMEHLGIAPSRTVGDALDFLLELRLDEGPLGKEEAIRRLDAWWSERGGN
ncbi:MAG: CCA tRNA nucleotidyltransferase [Actinomycetota bacterium]